MKLLFDCKTHKEIIFRGHVVMSRTEQPYLKCLIDQFRDKKIKSVLEIGFGLGISAGIIQDVLGPATHHIVEIEDSLYCDSLRFCRGRTGALAFFGDYLTFRYPQKYDLLFFDPYDYQLALKQVSAEQSFTREFNREVITAHKVLKEKGYLCHTLFGDCPPPELAGFTCYDAGIFTGAAMIVADGITITNARLGYYIKEPVT